MKFYRIFFLFFFGLALSFNASAKNLYVDGNTGDDALSYTNNSESTPWASLRRAVFGADSWAARNSIEATQAGDTVYVASGIYYAPGSMERGVPSFMNVNGGNATDGYITYQAQGFVELRLSSGRGPTIGAYSVGDIRNDFIKWKGFYINEAYAPHTPDTGPVVIFGSNNVFIEDCTIVGVTTNWGDNHNGIRFEGASYSTARNNTISGIHEQGSDGNIWHHNNAGIMLYGSNDILLENNDISDTGSGIFPKGNNNYNINIRKNNIHGVQKGIRISYSDLAGQNYIVQNIIHDGAQDDSMGIDLAEFTNHYIVANNTIHNVGNGINVRWSDNQSDIIIQNNIISNTNTAINAIQSAQKRYLTDYNLFYLTNQWAHSGSVHLSLSSWQNAVSDDASSVTSNPMFMDAGTDFKLIDGSPAASLGVDLLDLDGDLSTIDRIPAGAYVSGNEVIGRSGDTVPPVAPVLMSIE